MNDKKKRILHIVHRAKFTDGYIGFMTVCMVDYDHRFIITYGSDPIKSAGQENVFVLEHNEDLTNQPQYQEMMREADQIIVTGVFQRSAILRIPGSMLKKTWFHFWGGDFYCYREKPAGIRDSLQRHAMFRCFRKAAGLVFLLDGEAKSFSEITGIYPENVLAAPMYGDPREGHREIIKGLRDKASVTETVQILLGNSATRENQHLEALDMLKRFSGENIRIICPLSYGDPQYADTIVEYGRECFGSKFVPLLDYMAYEQYINILSDCRIGVFNNDRQQGMGNINAMIAMGKKVYIRQGTSMWDNYVQKGYHVFPMSEINEDTWDDIARFPDDEKNENQLIYDRLSNSENALKAWNKVFRFPEIGEELQKKEATTWR